MAKQKIDVSKRNTWFSKYRWLFLAALITGVVAVIGGWWISQASADEASEPPEAEKVLAVQAGMPFQILIPGFLPPAFARQNMEIQVEQLGPGGEPMVQLTYYPVNGSPLFIREWVPVNPDMEILANSRPVETQWGKGWLLKQGEDLIALWVDIGPLRASIYTSDQQNIDKEHLLAIAETMGPASNNQVFSFIAEPPKVKEALPAPPVEIATNAEGVQEVTLIVTPGGYSPLRFAVKKGVKVRLIFRQLGEVGCGNELNFPISSSNRASLKLKSPSDKQVLEFIPEDTGQFEFFCGHLMYRGVLYVHE